MTIGRWCHAWVARYGERGTQSLSAFLDDTQRPGLLNCREHGAARTDRGQPAPKTLGRMPQTTLLHRPDGEAGDGAVRPFAQRDGLSRPGVGPALPPDEPATMLFKSPTGQVASVQGGEYLLTTLLSKDCLIDSLRLIGEPSTKSRSICINKFTEEFRAAR